jgi:probable HAF family extracellular repeat protein
MKHSTLLNGFISLLTAGAVFVLGWTPLSALAAPSYTWTEIVIPGKQVQITRGFNDLGQVTIVNTDGTTGIYRLGQFKPLPAPPAGYTVGASGINNSGVIVGFAYTSDPHYQAFMLKDGQYKFFTLPGWQSTEARSIGPSGLVVGISYQDSGEYAGWIYDPSTGTFTDATPPGSIFTILQGINRFGRISGSALDANLGKYAFTWQQGTLGAGATELVPFFDRLNLQGVSTNARGVNDAGVITGFLQNVGSTGQTVGFVGNASAGYQLLFPPGAAAAAATYCSAINNFGQVACDVQDALGNSLGAFIGTPQL